MSSTKLLQPTAAYPMPNPFADDVELEPYKFEPGRRPASETSSINPPDSALEEAPPPPYADNAAVAFTPTVHLQIDTAGKNFCSLPGPVRPNPIHVFAVDTATGSLTGAHFVSVRPKRSSGSCFLTSGETGASGEPVHLSSTTYRFGPGRPPQVRLFDPHRTAPRQLSDHDDDGLGRAEEQQQEEEGADDAAAWDSFTVEARGLLTRAQGFKTRLGTFEWRYASRAERKAAGADSLLVLDRVTRVALAQNGVAGGSGSRFARKANKDEEVRVPVAHFVRNAEFRSPGSSGRSAGNGGRLMVDMTALYARGSESEDDAKIDVAQMAQALVITTCLVMLKKEIDRRRAQQAAIMAAVISGGS